MTITRINPPDLPELPGVAHVVISEGLRTVHVAGQAPVDRTGALVGGDDLEAQAAAAFSNLGHALAAVGAGPAEVVRTVIYVADYRPHDLDAVVAGALRAFGDLVPNACTLLGVQALFHEGQRIEVDAVAALPEAAP
ncbi:MAG: RidA family protein [Acidimicrobiales bacterium]|nr:RidA family protein [Acidimicrobiales bacterium]